MRIGEIIKWLESLYANGETHIEGADTYEDPWPSNLRAIIHMLRERAALVFPEGSTADDRDRIVLRAVLERGRLSIIKQPQPQQGVFFSLLSRGLLTAMDRLGAMVELTPAGHHRLATLEARRSADEPAHEAAVFHEESYQAPAGLLVMDRWNDPEALLGRLAWLLSEHGQAEVKRSDPPAPFISKKAATMISEEARRLASYDKPEGT